MNATQMSRRGFFRQSAVASLGVVGLLGLAASRVNAAPTLGDLVTTALKGLGEAGVALGDGLVDVAPTADKAVVFTFKTIAQALRFAADVSDAAAKPGGKIAGTSVAVVGKTVVIAGEWLQGFGR